jgi:hypothetical protein
MPDQPEICFIGVGNIGWPSERLAGEELRNC